MGTDSGSHPASTLPAAPGATSPGYHEGPCRRCSRKGQHLGPCHQCCPRPCPHPSQCQAPFSYLKGRSAVEFTPANDWLLLILATRTRRCGRADSDIVECDLEGLPAGHETAGSAAAVHAGRVPLKQGQRWHPRSRVAAAPGYVPTRPCASHGKRLMPSAQHHGQPPEPQLVPRGVPLSPSHPGHLASGAGRARGRTLLPGPLPSPC